MMRRRASETGCAIAYLNRVGGQDELVFDGSSLLIDGDGSLHPPARAFETAWLSVDFDAAARRFSPRRSEEHTSELQSLMRISYAVFCLKKKTKNKAHYRTKHRLVYNDNIRHDDIV